MTPVRESEGIHKGVFFGEYPTFQRETNRKENEHSQGTRRNSGLSHASICLRIFVCSPLLVLKGINFTTGHIYLLLFFFLIVPRGRKSKRHGLAAFSGWPPPLWCPHIGRPIRSPPEAVPETSRVSRCIPCTYSKYPLLGIVGKTDRSSMVNTSFFSRGST